MYKNEILDEENVISASMKTLLLHTDEKMFIKDMNFIYLGASQGFAELTGLSSPDQLIGKTDFEIFANVELAIRYRDDDKRMLAKGEPLINYVEPIPSSDGESRYSSTSKYIIKNDSGKPIGLFGVSKDITREYEAKLNYEKELGYLFELPKNALFAVLFDITSWRVIDFRVRDEHNQVTSRFHTIDSFAEKAIESVVDDKDVKSFFYDFNQKKINEIFSSGKRTILMEYERYVSDNNVCWVEEEFHFLIDPVSGHRSLLAVVRDIDLEHQAQNEMIQAASQDDLTGLDNRKTVMNKILNFLDKSSDNETHSLFMIDIDDFKSINDNFGHQTGDIVLKKISSILSDSFSDGYVGRIGGDEFFAFIKNTTLKDIHEKAGRLIEELHYQFFFNKEIELTCSVGISLCESHKKDLDVLYLEADKALYNAKSLGKNQYSIFGISKYSDNNFQMINEISEEMLIADYHKITKRLIEQDYEFIALIDLKSNKVVRCDKSDHDKFLGLKVAEDYHQQLEQFISHYFIQQDSIEYLKVMSLPYVLTQLKERNKYVTSFVIKDDNNEIYYKEWHFLWLDNHHNQILLTSNDMTKMAEVERNSLTGLYNRQSFSRHVREKLNLKEDKDYLLVRWDIDNFRIFNDTFGTEVGDQLLHDIGLHVLNENRSDYIYGHIEADHFVALVPASDSQVDLWNVLVNKSLKTRAGGFKMSISVGVYQIVDKQMDVSLMCDRALLALRSVKESYPKRIAFYDETMRAQMLEEQMFIDDFEIAIEKEQFEVYFQPQIDYETNSLIGAEALVRWKHPNYGLIMPNRFISLFEKKGYILRLDEYVWEKSCRYLRSWIDSKIVTDSFTISVNISRIDIYSSQLVKSLENLMKKYRLSKSSFRLEITESAYMDTPQQLIDTVEKLQNAGFIIEMDDFGAGYSSLNILKDVPVNILKLDMLFLSNALADSRGGSILSSVIHMADWLQIPVIAEGVETKEVAEYLKSLGCIYMQGYYFSKPLPSHEFEVMLDESNIKEIIINKEGTENLDYFWNTSTQESLIFNRFVGGAAIIQYHNQEVQIIRANDKFYEELGVKRPAYQLYKLNVLDRFDEKNKTEYRNMLEKCIQSGEEVEAIIESLPFQKGQEGYKTYNTVQLLTKNGNRYLIYLTVKNISKFQKENESS